MYIDFMLFTVIALATGVIVLSRILSSNMKYQEKGFVQLIMLAICHNIIDIFWGLTYFDKLEWELWGCRYLRHCISARMPFWHVPGSVFYIVCCTGISLKNGYIFWQEFRWFWL